MSILFSEVYKNCMEWIQSVWAILSKQKQTDMYIKCLFLYQFKKKAYIYRWISLSRSSRDRCKISSYPKFDL